MEGVVHSFQKKKSEKLKAVQLSRQFCLRDKMCVCVCDSTAITRKKSCSIYINIIHI